MWNRDHELLKGDKMNYRIIHFKIFDSEKNYCEQVIFCQLLLLLLLWLLLLLLLLLFHASYSRFLTHDSKRERGLKMVKVMKIIAGWEDIKSSFHSPRTNMNINIFVL